MEDSGINNGYPFGRTDWGEDTGCRYQGKEIRVGRHFTERDVWIIMRTGTGGQLPHEPLLDRPEGEPRKFENAAVAWNHARNTFRTVGSVQLGEEFQVRGRPYIRIKIPNYKSATNFVTVLDLESFSVSEMAYEMKPDPATKDGEATCEPSSSTA